MEEIWKDIEGYEGYYQVSNLGRVRSLDHIDCRGRHIKGKTTKQLKDKDGYYYVQLNKNGVQTKKKVHRLVAIAFIPNPENKREVSHLDETKTNNQVSNLEWATSKENNNMPIRRQRLSQYLKTHPLDNKGEKNGMYGKHHSIETRQKMSQNRKRKYNNE